MNLRSTYLRVASLGALLLCWHLVSNLPWVISIPSPVAVLRAGLGLDPGMLLREVLLSLYRVVSGFVLATLVGVPLGIWIGSSGFARRLLFPLVEVMRPIPPIAWIPLAILFFVEPQSMILFLTFLGALFPILYNTIAGISGVNQNYVQAAESLGADGLRLFVHIVFPAMLPAILAGLQVAIGTAWLMVVAAEMMASKGGIGAMTWEAFQTGRYALVFVGMALIGASGAACSWLLKALSNRIVTWRAP